MKKNIFILPIILVLLFTQCDESNYYSNDSSDTGTAGSLARFAIAENYLYTVELEKRKIFSIANEKEPVFIKQINPGFGIETIFARDQYLFLGSRWGVYIYDITLPENPFQLSMFSHIYSYDPVVISGNFAYATLSSSRTSGWGVDELIVIDITNKTNPQEVATLAMENPRGLGISGNLLFVCDNGIKVYDISNPSDLQFIRKESVSAFDVIPLTNILIVVSETGLYEYEFNSEGELTLLSTIHSNK